MEITDIRVRQVFDEGKMKARVSITFDNQFVVHEIKVIEGEKGVFIAMPSKKLTGGEFKDIAHPINKETRAQLQEAILSAYIEKVNNETLKLATNEE
ncbi:MAG: septation regulator SpoVG [Eubacteriaceae bacterium]|nr:septation regulator SpoVG [Eubacteriaceae bacterium]